MKAKIVYALSLIVYMSFSVAADCDKNFQLNYIDTLIVTCPAEIVIKQGDKNEYCFSADPDTLNQIKVDLDTGGDLKFLPKNSVDNPKDLKPLYIYLTVKDLQNINLENNANCVIQDLSVRKLIVKILGNSKFKARMQLQEFHVDILGNADISLKGSTQDHKLRFEGSGSYDAAMFSSQQVIAYFAGSTESYLKALKSLNVTSIGNNKITYSGNPKDVKSNMMGGFLKKI